MRRVAGCLIVAGFAAAALVVPVAATAQPSLVAQAKAAVQKANASEEALHTIPFKRGTSFTITCAIVDQGHNVLCTEHAGPQTCVKNQPWISLSDDFPIIKGRLGSSTIIGLDLTYTYCKHS
jgi:hypothetical protein